MFILSLLLPSVSLHFGSTNNQLKQQHMTGDIPIHSTIHYIHNTKQTHSNENYVVSFNIWHLFHRCYLGLYNTVTTVHSFFSWKLTMRNKVGCISTAVSIIFLQSRKLGKTVEMTVCREAQSWRSSATQKNRYVHLWYN